MTNSNVFSTIMLLSDSSANQRPVIYAVWCWINRKQMQSSQFLDCSGVKGYL